MNMSATSETLHVFNRSVPVPEEDYSASPYLDIHAHDKVQFRILRVLLACAGVVILAQGIAVWKLAMRPPERIVVRVDPSGQAVATDWETIAYSPREEEFKYFLSKFTKDHFSMVRATIQEGYSRKLMFLSDDLARALMNAEQQDKTITKFLSDSSSEEIEVYVTKVAIEDMRTAPYKATVDFEKVYRYRGDSHEAKRTKHTAHYQFNLITDPEILRNRPDLIKVNPLLFVITYFRSDEAF
jgi:type IV secretory pathway TrbF-like protein